VTEFDGVTKMTS